LSSSASMKLPASSNEHVTTLPRGMRRATAY
jgi:hypothetical protein